MIRSVILIGYLFTACIGNVIAADSVDIPSAKDVIEFETRLGIVTFAHKKHADLSITQCVTCHHKHEPTESVIKPCHECHKSKSTEPIKASKAFHTRCTGCHEYTVAGGQQAGPLKKKCKLCHVKPVKN